MAAFEAGHCVTLWRTFMILKVTTRSAIDLYKEALSYDSTVVDIYKRLGELLPNEDGNYYRIQAVKLQQN